MNKRIILPGILALLFLCANISAFSQEEVPVKTFEFSISINKLKTESQANAIQNEVALLPGVKNCELILINYLLTFSCTNHAMKEFNVMDRIKAIIVSHGAEIVQIERREV